MKMMKRRMKRKTITMAEQLHELSEKKRVCLTTFHNLLHNLVVAIRRVEEEEEE